VNRPASIIFAALTAIAVVALIWFLRMDWIELAAAAKFLASCGFLATAASAGALRNGFGRIIFAGLLLSMAGDMFLVGETRQHFLLGLISFLLAHIAYVTAFVINGQDRRWVMLSTGPIVIIAVLVLFWLGPHVPGELAMPVRLYTAVISLMVITAFGSRGAGAPRIIVAGALMFYLSDLSVAMQRIVESDFPTYIWGLPLYYAAQLCFAFGASHSTSQDGTPAK